MAQELINTGTSNNSGNGDTLRSAFDKTNDNFTELFEVTGWQSIFEGTSNQTLLLTNNLITITGTIDGNGNLDLLDANGKVTPLQENDVLAIDFGCTVVTPSGSDNYIHLKYIVNNVVYRAITIPLLKGSGNNDEVSLSATLPVSNELFLNGLEVYIEPNTALDINNKYIAVTRIHTAR